MGNLLRIAIFIIVLGALSAGTAAALLQERQRHNALERIVQGAALAPNRDDLAPTALLKSLRERHVRAQRAILLLGGLALACAIALAIVPTRAPAASPTPDSAVARSEMRGLETLARATAAQAVELEHEREARHRSEQNLTLQQLLANQALQDKIHLGRDLHDGLIQTLYATGLVLETATQRLTADPLAPSAPADAARLIDRAKTTLNVAIRQARGTIGELTPDAIDQQSFADAVLALLDHLGGETLLNRQVTLAPELPFFSEPARTELLQIIRESVSNALRHGSATRIEIDFVPLPDTRLRLTIRDDGQGFDPAAITRGHGLDNLAARARTIDAQLDIDAAPGRGTCITLILPVPASTANEGRA